VNGRGIHTLPVRGATDDWLTPPEIVQALGQFALDPCAHPQQFYRTAKRMIAPPDDGLAVKWKGRVWLNPPYGDKLKGWISRLAEHGDGIALVPARTDVESWFWPFVWEAADAVLFLRGRVWFFQPDGTRVRIVNGKRKKTGNAGHGSILAAYGVANVRALEQSGIIGRFFKLK
jgi:hypothetical protein